MTRTELLNSAAKLLFDEGQEQEQRAVEDARDLLAECERALAPFGVFADDLVHDDDPEQDDDAPNELWSVSDGELKAVRAVLEKLRAPIGEKLMSKPDWEGFGKAVMRCWPHGDVDGFELQFMAEAYHVIVPAEGGYDPDKHGDDSYGAEPGDSWFERNYTPLPSETKS